VVLEAIRGDGTVNEIASDHDLNPNLVRKWAAKAESDMARAFTTAEDERERERGLAGRQEEVDDLRRKIGEITAERDCLQRGLLARYGIDIEDVPGGPGKRRG
jgi:transposase